MGASPRNRLQPGVCGVDIIVELLANVNLARDLSILATAPGSFAGDAASGRPAGGT